ncbi:MAG: tetratricopeptide repeat protein [Sandaracinus sp.]
MTLDCETCDALLIDLVLNELDEARAAEVRAHAASCESCTRALARLEGGRKAARELARVEPPRLDGVLAAARARAAEARAARHAPAESMPAPAPAAPASAGPSESWLDTTLRWLGGWASRPQVAMAAVLVLVLGIGLFNLPALRSHDELEGEGTLVEPSGQVALGPSLDPAAPLEIDVDAQRQRVALRTEGESAQEVGARDVRPTTTVVAEATPTSADRPTTHADHGVREATSEERSSAADESSALAALVIPPSSGTGRVEDGVLPDITSETAGSTTASVYGPGTTPAPPAMAPSRSGVTAPPPVPTEEVEPGTPSPAGLLPAAIHRQARALASAGHCDQAIPRYRSLLTTHPDYADAPRAMIELADCDRRVGQLDEAARWLARAETFPSVSADARRERARLETARAASARAATDVVERSAAATDRPAEAAPPSAEAGF